MIVAATVVLDKLFELCFVHLDEARLHTLLLFDCLRFFAASSIQGIQRREILHLSGNDIRALFIIHGLSCIIIG